MQSTGMKPIVIRDIFTLADRLDSLEWEPFRPGVRIHRLYGNASTGPSAAFLLYDVEAGVPLHEHQGFEHLIVLTHFQTDERGHSISGDLVINPPGSTHSVKCPKGCLVLAIWEKPVAFL